MVRLLTGGILPSGDPTYEDNTVIGLNAPTNVLLDPVADIPVSQLILQTFDIPFDLNNVLGGKLPGLDIHNQDTTTMMKLSLATELLDAPEGSAGFAEVELDAFGMARFYVVGQTIASNLDIRYCIPTSQVVNPADLVIVRGYDPPPRRELRPPFDGLKGKEIMDYKDCAMDSCDESVVSQYATVTYDDPQLDQTYLDDIVNSYELQAFETLLGYLIDLDLPNGTDPNSPSYIPGLKITFGDSTKEYIKVSSSLMNANILGGTLIDDSGNTTTINGASSNVSSQAIAGAGSGSPIPATVTVVSARGDKCTTFQTALAGSDIRLAGSRFKRLNKFGVEESDFIGVVDVVFSGRKVQSVTISPGVPSIGLDGLVQSIVRPNKELVSLQQGKNWTYSIDPQTLDVTVSLFSIIEDAFTEIICNAYRNPVGATGNPTTTTRTLSTADLFNSEVTTFSDHICNVGDSLGYKVNGGTLCIVVERKRPSIDIFDPTGNALQKAQQISVEYTPIVIVDEPAPIAYAATGALDNFASGGSKTIPANGIIDQADGIVDNNPNTTQALQDSEISVLQDNTTGTTIDISLPFCTDTECLQIAKNFLELQTEIVSTHSMILGPDSEPRLGDLVNLPNGQLGSINEINYSYSDSSQYLITVTVGPIYLTAGSFNDPKYQLRTEDVSREGWVVQDKGNGAEYVVRIEGYGEITALLMVLDDVSVGDKCGIRIYNNPVERI